MFWGAVWGFEQDDDEGEWWGGRVRGWVWGIFGGCILSVGIISLLVVFSSLKQEDNNNWQVLDIVYTLGYTKLLITTLKYLPQALTNYHRKSTIGWSITQILLDFLGGVLSIVQLVIDSGLQADWSGLTGNPVKFGLGNVSIGWNLVFLWQHYVLYKEREEGERGEGEERDEERRRLLVR